jgi:DNA-binding NtrC family response regulator
MNEGELPKVLVVDDDRGMHLMLALRLKGKAVLLSAHTLDEARALFAANRDSIRLVVLDGCLHSAFQVQTPDTLPLIPEFRATFRGPIIAASSFPDFRQAMVKAGCTHNCDRDWLSREIERLLADGQEGRSE